MGCLDAGPNWEEWRHVITIGNSKKKDIGSFLFWLQLMTDFQY